MQNFWVIDVFPLKVRVSLIREAYSNNNSFERNSAWGVIFEGQKTLAPWRNTLTYSSKIALLTSSTQLVRKICSLIKKETPARKILKNMLPLQVRHADGDFQGPPLKHQLPLPEKTMMIKTKRQTFPLTHFWLMALKHPFETKFRREGLENVRQTRLATQEIKYFHDNIN